MVTKKQPTTEELLDGVQQSAADVLAQLNDAMKSDFSDESIYGTAEVPASPVWKPTEDKKPEDEKQPALMRSVIRIGRAQLRKATASIKTQAEAAVVAKLGSSRIVNNTGETGGSNVGAFSAKVDEYFNASKGKINHAKATARVARDFPELYEEHRKSIFRS